MNRATKNAWFSVLAAAHRPRATLVCFPYGGGNAAAFRAWARHTPADVQLLGVELPGRGVRFGEPTLTRVADVIDGLLEQSDFLAQQGDLILFGHSLGALLAFEFARALEHGGAVAPAHLVASGRGAPHLPRREAPVHGLPDAQFLAQVRRFEGLPDAVLQHAELLEIFLPILRADFTLSETYECVPGAPLDCDLTVLGGTRDPMVDVATLAPWREHARGHFACRTFDGGHFFLNDHAAQIVALALRNESAVTSIPALRDAHGSPNLTCTS